MAREDQSPVVCLYLASALQRLSLAEPNAGESVASAAKLLAKTKIPKVREFITRRMTAITAK